jgi:hypothetical protein
MSSWSNRNIPRKRDLSQIPSEFRPHLISRSEQPQVVLSETFQIKPVNEIVYPTDKKAELTISDLRPHIRKIDAIPLSAIPLLYNGLSYVFVILRHIRTNKDNDLWISSYNSIRKFYTNPIKIIDDNSSINTVNGKLIDTEVIYSEWNGAGEILPYYYFMKHKWADRMIFIHDSMFLVRPFTEDELSDSVRFHWYFLNKNDDRKYPTYLSILSNSSLLIDYMKQLSSWKGCFGATCMIDLSIVQGLEEKYGLFSRLVMALRTRSDREMFERIFGMILFYEGHVTDQRCSNFGNILEYPGAFESQVLNIESASHKIIQANYDSAIIKVWRGR